MTRMHAVRPGNEMVYARKKGTGNISATSGTGIIREN
jgi:hypothetical protein